MKINGFKYDNLMMTLSKDAASCQHLGMLQNKKKVKIKQTNQRPKRDQDLASRNSQLKSTVICLGVREGGYARK